MTQALTSARTAVHSSASGLFLNGLAYRLAGLAFATVLPAAFWVAVGAGIANAAGVTVPASALIEVGAVIALWGGLLATALNGYSQHMTGLGADWQQARGGHAFRVTGLALDRSADGGRGGDAAFRAVAEVELHTPADGVLRGQTLYRDGRSAIAGYAGPVRQICEILDYRYARYSDRPGYVLHPFIDRSWSRDLQLWVSTSAAVAALEGGPQDVQAVVVVRVLPFASLLWLGLALATVGALVEHVQGQGIAADKIVLAGFSQGACLAAEFAARHAQRWGGLLVFSGGLIGQQIDPARYSGDFAGTPVFIGCDAQDFHIPLARVQETTAQLRTQGAAVTERIYQGMGHTISDDEIAEAKKVMVNL